jgi:hypothetical protein
MRPPIGDGIGAHTAGSYRRFAASGYMQHGNV